MKNRGVFALFLISLLFASLFANTVIGAEETSVTEKKFVLPAREGDRIEITGTTTLPYESDSQQTGTQQPATLATSDLFFNLILPQDYLLKMKSNFYDSTIMVQDAMISKQLNSCKGQCTYSLTIDSGLDDPYTLNCQLKIDIKDLSKNSILCKSADPIQYGALGKCLSFPNNALDGFACPKQSDTIVEYQVGAPGEPIIPTAAVIRNFIIIGYASSTIYEQKGYLPLSLEILQEDSISTYTFYWKVSTEPESLESLQQATTPSQIITESTMEELGTLGEETDQTKLEQAYTKLMEAYVKLKQALSGEKTVQEAPTVKTLAKSGDIPGTDKGASVSLPAAKNDVSKISEVGGKVEVPVVTPTGSGTKEPKLPSTISLKPSSNNVGALGAVFGDLWKTSKNLLDSSPAIVGETTTVSAATEMPGSPTGGAGLGGGSVSADDTDKEEEKPSTNAATGSQQGTAGGATKVPEGSTVEVPINNPEENLMKIDDNTCTGGHFLLPDGTTATETSDSQAVMVCPDVAAPPSLLIEDEYGNLEEFEIPIYVDPPISPAAIVMITFAILALLTVSGVFGKAYAKKKRLKKLESEIAQQAARASEFMNM